jgi:integrase
VKFPHTVRFRTLTATIYGRSDAYPFYRLAVRVAGKRVVRSFQTFADAKAEAEAKLRQTASGNVSAGLSAKESADAIAIRQALAAFHRDTGRTLSALEAATTCLDALRLLPANVPLVEAVRTYCRTLATIKAKSLAAAVKEFNALRSKMTLAKEGKRPQLNPKYQANVEAWLNDFSAKLPGHDMGDLAREHLAAYMANFSELGPKSRNDRRVTITMFLRWCQRQDYLPADGRLLQADALVAEPLDDAAIKFYSPKELAALLEKSKGAMRAVIALQALGGLRLEECLRLDWRDVFAIPGHVEVSSAKSKTRSRRLVEICPALEAWLKEFRGSEGKVSQWQTTNGAVQAFMELRKSLGIPSQKNGLRHGFVSAHFALHQNESQTAAQVGSSPQMLFQHYRGLMARAEAEKWFAALPADAKPAE